MKSSLVFISVTADLDAKHFIEPLDATKMVELANIILSYVKRPIAFLHLPVPIDRTDDAFFVPLKSLHLPKDTELYLGLVHVADGVEGTIKRMKVAKKYVPDFGIGTECGNARCKSPEVVKQIMRIHAGAAESAVV